MQDVFKDFPVSTEEFVILEKKYGNLCHFSSWQLIKRNNNNNSMLEEEDITQDLRIALMRACSYHKRQVYLERCLHLCGKHIKDKFCLMLLKDLKELWANKTRHGANKQKFGVHQENLLERLTKRFIPKENRPEKDAKLKIDNKFNTYCKTIVWNAQKALGKKVTREKSVRHGMVSLSEYDYLAEL